MKNVQLQFYGLVKKTIEKPGDHTPVIIKRKLNGMDQTMDIEKVNVFNLNKKAKVCIMKTVDYNIYWKTLKDPNVGECIIALFFFFKCK